MPHDLKTGDADIWQGYCRACGYQLRGLESRRCPECGRDFDPDYPKTYRRKPLRPWKRWVMRAAVLLLLLATIPTAGIAWLYWEWRQEQPAQELTESTVAYLDLVGPRWLHERMPARLSWLLWRTTTIQVRDMRQGQLHEPDLAALAKLKHLEEVILSTPDVTDAGLEHLQDLTQLKRLDLSHTRTTDAGLACLQNLRNLEYLNLRHTRIQGAGLGHLQGMENLETLHLGDNPQLSQDAAEDLANALPRTAIYY
jgi:hypothetical protein